MIKCSCWKGRKSWRPQHGLHTTGLWDHSPSQRIFSMCQKLIFFKVANYFGNVVWLIFLNFTLKSVLCILGASSLSGMKRIFGREICVAIFFYRGRSGARVTQRICLPLGAVGVRSRRGTLPRLKPKQEIEIPMFYNYLSCWAETLFARCAAPLCRLTQLGSLQLTQLWHASDGVVCR